MIASRSHQGVARGRTNGRSSTNQDPSENAYPGFFSSRAPSVSSTSTTRRPRGFQPAEVNKPSTKIALASRDSETSVDDRAIEGGISLTKAQAAVNPQRTIPSNAKVLREALMEHLPELKTPPMPEPFKKSQAPVAVTAAQENELQTDKKATDPSNLTAVPNVTMITPKPEFGQPNANTGGESSPSESSSIPIIVGDQSRKSCWSRALPPEPEPPSQAVTPKATWDNSTYAIDRPSWAVGSASLPIGYKGAVNANLFNLPPYKSPFKTPEAASSPETQRTSSSSFRRQIANIKQGTKQVQTVHAQETGSPDQDNEVEKAVVPSVDGSQERHSANFTSADGSAKIAPHLRAQGTPAAGITNQNDQATKSHSDMIAPHLKKSVGRSEASTQDEVGETTAEQTIAAMLNYKPPPHLQGRSTTLSAPALGSSAKATPPPKDKTDVKMLKRDINANEEIATSHCFADTENDAAIAAIVAAEVNEHEGKVLAALQAEPSDPKKSAQHLGKMNHEGQDRLEPAPPHLRKSNPKAAALDKKPDAQSSAAIRPDASARDHQVTPVASCAQTLMDTEKSTQDTKTSQLVSTVAVAGDATLSTNKGKGKERAVGFDAENSPSKLVGWDGKLAPAPLGDDWEYRAQFKTKDKDKLAVIKTWTEEHASDMDTGLGTDKENLISHVDADHPETLPNPDEFNLAKRHVSANHHIEAYEARRSANGQVLSPSAERLTRDERRKNRRIHKEIMNSTVHAPNEHAPAANIYLRPAEMKDMRQVMLLHNYFILKSACANELGENDEIYWRSRFQECHDEGDPFLVAIHKGQKATKDVQDTRRKKSDTVVGFAFASDYGLPRTAYRFTVELELWVHPAHTHQGIGKSMLDRMLGALDPGYNILECAPLLGRYDATRWSGGGRRIVKTILVNLLYNKIGEENLEWTKKWLSEKEFEYQGTLSEIGFKFGKSVNQCQMIYKTAATLPPSPLGGSP